MCRGRLYNILVRFFLELIMCVIFIYLLHVKLNKKTSSLLAFLFIHNCLVSYVLYSNVFLILYNIGNVENEIKLKINDTILRRDLITHRRLFCCSLGVCESRFQKLRQNFILLGTVECKAIIVNIFMYYNVYQGSARVISMTCVDDGFYKCRIANTNLK